VIENVNLNMQLNREIEMQLPKMVELFERHEVSCASLFGSCMNDRFNEASDVDVLVEFSPQIDPIVKGTALLELEGDLEQLLHRKVDLISYSAIRNPYFLSEVNETRMIVYGKSIEKTSF
jgi:predicted nucleotidyltransferase